MSSKSKRISRQSTLNVSLRRNSEIVEAFSLFDKVRLEKEKLLLNYCPHKIHHIPQNCK